jgi:16S rRNA (guanine(527)-N(7))-methyltransferase RsmG
MIPMDYLKEQAQAFSFSLNDEKLCQFDRYAELLCEWNEKINLTSITEPNEIVIKHFLDSILLLDGDLVGQGSALIDVGTGAGFPSIPCKIVRPDLTVTLLDSLQKRIRFLDTVVQELSLSDVESVHGRAEDMGRLLEYREQYDIATARAVAHLRELSEYCLPFVKVGGCFIALKGYEVEQELEEAKKAISLMGGAVEAVKKYELPQENRRAIVVIRKKSQTPTKYPRMAAKMKKQPL